MTTITHKPVAAPLTASAIARLSPLDRHLLARLGPLALEDTHEICDEQVPPVVFRTMSEEHFQLSLATGWHVSDERDNFLGQAARRPEDWVGSEHRIVPEGTVAGRWAYSGYLNHSPDGIGRVVMIATHPDDGWELHLDGDDEGGYFRTLQPIPVIRFITYTERVDSRTWLPLA